MLTDYKVLFFIKIQSLGPYVMYAPGNDGTNRKKWLSGEKSKAMKKLLFNNRITMKSMLEEDS